MLYSTRVYCPYDLSQFLLETEAIDIDEAKQKIIGRTVTCTQQLHKFEVEDHFIIGVYPAPERVPHPPYEVADLNHGRPPKWSLGVNLVGDQPAPIHSMPIGSPYLKKTVADHLTTLIYEQKVKSKRYPEYTFHIQFPRHVFTKFLDRAKEIKREKNIKDAILYLIDHSYDLTTSTIADALEIGYWTAHRYLIELREENKIVETGSWRGKLTFGPLTRKSEDELMEELRDILTFELGREPTITEWEPMEKAVRRQLDKNLQQRIVSYLEEGIEEETEE